MVGGVGGLRLLNTRHVKVDLCEGLAVTADEESWLRIKSGLLRPVANPRAATNAVHRSCIQKSLEIVIA